MKQERLLKLLPTRNENAMKNDREQPHVTFGCDLELEPGRYLYVPCDFLCSMHLSPTAKVLYLVLCCHASRGARLWPGQARLCRECAADAGTMRSALSKLIAAGLVSCRKGSAGNQSGYFVHRLDRLSDTEFASTNDAAADKPINNMNGTHILPIRQTLNQEQIQTDTELLSGKVGISKEAAKDLAQLAAQRGCLDGYVAEVVEYALSTPGIKNPAGCVVQLIRRGESRKPGSQLPRQGGTPALDAEKYTVGKYAFLFQRLNGSAGVPAVPQDGSGGQHEGDVEEVEEERFEETEGEEEERL